MLTLKKADCVLVVGDNLVEDHQVVGFFVKRLIPNGTHLIVLDSEKNLLENYADVVLTPSKGGEVSVLQSLVDGKAKDTAAKAVELLTKASNLVIVYGSTASEAVIKSALDLAKKYKGVLLGTRGSREFAADYF